MAMTPPPPFGRLGCLFIHIYCMCCQLSDHRCNAYYTTPNFHPSRLASRSRSPSASLFLASTHRSSSSFLFALNTNNFKSKCSLYIRDRTLCSSLKISTVDIEVSSSHDDGVGLIGNSSNHKNHKSSEDGFNFLSWKDILPLSFYTAVCLIIATMVSTYEDYDVTHVRPNPSTLRRPTSVSQTSSMSGGTQHSLDFIGAATQGMGWNRGASMSTNSNTQIDEDSNTNFEEWYGTSATTLQWIPTYNEIMLQHRVERIPRWNKLDGSGDQLLQSSQSLSSTSTSTATTSAAVPTKEELKMAVLQLYKSLDDLDELKLMADDYMWDEIKEKISSATSINLASKEESDKDDGHSLRMVLEYSMDTLKASPSYYSVNNPNSNGIGKFNLNKKDAAQELETTIGFDWGSCAWRHCGAKADAQESLAELYSSVGMLEPFECRFVIDIIERSIRDVLAAVPEDLLPHENGVLVHWKPYVPYVSQGENEGEDGMGLDTEYLNALSGLREDLSIEER